MPSSVLEDIYKIRSSEFTVPQIMEIIYEKEKQVLSETNGKLNLKGSTAMICLRDLKEWLYKSEHLRINTYTFRKKLDEIKKNRGYIDGLEDIKPINISDLTDAREMLEIGIDNFSGAEREAFQAIYNIFF